MFLTHLRQRQGLAARLIQKEKLNMEVKMMQAKEVEALITAMVEPLLQDTGLTLVDVEYVREKDWYLRIFLDKPGGVEIDDCQMVSEKLTEIIRENDIKSVTVVRMEVPCCGGLELAAKKALQQSGKFIPWQVVTVTVDGRLVEE